MVTEFGTFANPDSSHNVVLNGKHANEIAFSPKLHATSWTQSVLKLNPRLFNVLAYDLEQSKPSAATTSILSVTIPKPITTQVLVALIYSYIPFVMFFGFFGWFIATESVVPLYGTILLIVTSLTSEGVLKNIFRQPRPFESAVESYGMPSSHCMTAYAILIWIIGDTATSAMSIPFKLAWICLILLLLVPIPWARYFLGDHSVSQCIAGCAGGIAFGLVASVLWFHVRYANINSLGQDMET